MEEKTKMSWKFLRFSKFKEKTAKTKQPPEQPLRQVYANARAGDKVHSFVVYLNIQVTIELPRKH